MRAQNLEPVLHGEQGANCCRVREIREYVMSAAGLQIRNRIASCRDADALRADRPGCMNVARRVADHDHSTTRERHAELLGTALGSQANHLRARLGITPKAAETKVVMHAHALELDARAFTHISRAEPNGHLRTLRRRDRLLHPR